MIEDKIKRVEEQLQNAQGISGEAKKELLELVNELKKEVGDLQKTHEEEAKSIAGFAEVSAHEATRSKPDQDSLNYAVKGMSHSVRGFEASHPRLFEVINTICNSLANIGI